MQFNKYIHTHTHAHTHTHTHKYTHTLSLSLPLFLTRNRVLHQALARSLRESKVQFVVEDTWPFQQRASEQNGRLNPLRMDITIEAGALFDNDPRLRSRPRLRSLLPVSRTGLPPRYDALLQTTPGLAHGTVGCSQAPPLSAEMMTRSE